MMDFRSRRSPVVARNGMVATSQPLAAQAGLRMLMEGGNAVDAAVATAAALAVVEPMSTGIGGDAFALVWMNNEKRVRALNGSGRSPAAASLDTLRSRNFQEIPTTSPWAVSIPGTVDAWQTILERYGTMPLPTVLAPAIAYAENGYPVSPVIAHQWGEAEAKLSQRPSGQELLLNGSAPRAGELMRLPELAKVLQDIAEGGRDCFYDGPLAEKIAKFVQSEGGWITTEDLNNHSSTWDEPISTEYRGITCWECPPNGQGLVALIALNILEGFNLAEMGSQSVASYHHMIESVRLAFSDGLRYIADPHAVAVPTDELLSMSYADERRRMIQPDQAMPSVSFGRLLSCQDTVYITCADRDGNACSFINSLFQGFGTGLVVPGTGIALQNRAALFSLDPDHPNALAPNIRPYHTIIPAMATRNDELWLSFGVMGGFQQPQGHVQVLANMLDYNLDPQEALDALRFSVSLDGTGSVALEDGIDPKVIEGLQKQGHPIEVVSGYPRTAFGGGQVIERDPDSGILRGGSEPRKDGCAIGW
jgi:gamma-glutamyltranspeptidase/glutathione hydrolase